jgi:formylglycine-generating enzyme required for sulfatase activity
VVGEFELSDSPYGTFDMGGNVFEWNETWIYEDRAAKVCTQAVTGRRQEPKIRVFEQIFNKAVSEKKILDSST